MRAVNAMNVLKVFCSCYTVISKTAYLYNMAKTNHIDSTGPAPISTNESTTVY